MVGEKRASVPLAWRVPNAPPTFVGRRAELRAIRAAAQRGPLVVLHGPGGRGKSALAAAAVHDVLADRAKRAVLVSARPSEPFRQVLADVVRALGSAAARGDADMTMLAIDVADARRALIVLDDLHHALPEANGALVAIMRHARRALWVATSRALPEAPELAGQVVTVPPLPSKELARVARIVNPGLSTSDAARIGREAVGSPWRARQLASDRAARRAGDETRDAVLGPLSEVEGPISTRTLAGAVAGNFAETMDELVSRGVVEAVAGGYRLHEEARPLVASWMTRAPDSARTIAVLAAGGHAEAVEALRLALRSGDARRALAVCEASFDEMLREGHAPTVWRAIASCEGRAWSSYKLRTAMQLADVKITTVLDEPEREALVDRLLWVRALSVEARAADAERAAEALSAAARERGDERIAYWAAVEHAMAARVHSGPERGLLLLEGAAPIDGATRALRSALSAFWLAEVGRIEESIRTLERSASEDGGAALETPLAAAILGGPLDFLVRYYRMAAFMECGHLNRAYDEITAGRANLDADDQMRASYIELDGIANLSIARGRLAEARGMLDRLLRSAPPRGGSTYQLIARLLDVEWRIAAGAFGDVVRALTSLGDDARPQSPLVFAWCADTWERLHLALGRRDDSPVDLKAAPLGGVARNVLALRHALRLAHWGEQAELPGAIDVEGSIVRALVRSTQRLVTGEDAVADARAALDLATAHGWGVRECEARTLVVEALIARGYPDAARAEARALAKRAAAMASARFAAEARLLASLVADPPLDAAELEDLAMAEEVAPCAARRARALLGDAVTLDAVDERVLGAARERAAVEIIRLRRADAHSRGWGVDMRRLLAWLPDGRRVSLSRHATLARVLEVIAHGGGVASFETLAREVWQRPKFHPLHDANRIRVTLHRLRALVESDPARPQRIVSSGSSYALGGEPFTLVSASLEPRGASSPSP